MLNFERSEKRANKVSLLIKYRFLKLLTLRRELLFEGLDDFQVNIKNGKFIRIFQLLLCQKLMVGYSASLRILHIANDFEILRLLNFLVFC